MPKRAVQTSRYLNCTGRSFNNGVGGGGDVGISADFGFYEATAVHGPNGTFCSSRNDYLSGLSATESEGQGS